MDIEAQIAKNNLFWRSLIYVSNPEDYRFLSRTIPKLVEPTGGIASTTTSTTTSTIVADSKEIEKDTYSSSYMRYAYTEEEKKMFFNKFKDGNMLYKYENKYISSYTVFCNIGFLFNIEYNLGSQKAIYNK